MLSVYIARTIIAPSNTSAKRLVCVVSILVVWKEKVTEDGLESSGLVKEAKEWLDGLGVAE